MRIGAPAGWALLRQRDFRLLWTAHAGSVVGDGFHGIAATWLVFETLGGGPQALAVLGIAYLVPHLALGVLSGTIVDRIDRRRVMVASDLVRAALVALLAVLVWLELATVPVVIATGMGLVLAGIFFYPARNAVLPAYVAADDLVPANAMFATVYQTGQLVTPAIGGILFVVIGPAGLLAIDALSFLWSALLLIRLTPGPALPGPEPRRPLLEEAADGLRFIAGHPPSRLVVLVGAANQLFASGPWRTMVPAWVAVVLGGGAPEYGVLTSAFAAGLLASSLGLSVIRARLPLLTLVMAGVFVDGAINIAFAHAPTLALASLAFVAMGLSNGVLNTSFSASLQLTVPSHMRGRTFATFGTVMNLTTPVSLAVTGALAAAAGPVLLITGAGVGLMAVGAAGLAAWTRLERATRLATA
jgi:DHA3 family macrolide efflux protein-like MFS transporter